METLSPRLSGYGLTTASICYRIPDFQLVLQTFIWQDYDTEPAFPKLHAFLDYWAAHLDGPLFSVRIAHHLLIAPEDCNKRLH